MPTSRTENFSLNVEERAVFSEVIEQSLVIINQEQFFQWTQTELQKVFPHGMLACGIGRICKLGIEVQHIMGCNFPQEYWQSLKCSNVMLNSPILAKWMQERQPVLFQPQDSSFSANSSHSAWLDTFHRFGLLNIAAYGQCDVGSQTASYFSFSGIPGSLSLRHAFLLKLLVPHLHVVLTRVVANLCIKPQKCASSISDLTKRELEVLKWLCDGKTNWEIAQICCISESTAKNHVQKILEKLNVNNRTQAVTKFKKLKLLPKPSGGNALDRSDSALKQANLAEV